MKKKSIEPSIIKTGFIDYYYCFKLHDSNDFISVVEKILKDKCCIVNFNSSDDNELFYRMNNDFETFIQDELKKDIDATINAIKEFDVDTEAALTTYAINDITELNNYSIDHTDTQDSSNKLKLIVQHPLDLFIKKSISSMSELINETQIYLSKNLKFYKSSFILQPIMMLIDEKKYYINVTAAVYATGNLILQYTVPIKNIEFDKFHTVDNNLNFKCKVPLYIIDKKKSFEYSKCLNLDDAIIQYNEYIKKLINKKISSNNSFTNYSLIDYSNIPEDFDSASNDLKRDLFWLVNSPYAYLNEQEKNSFNLFFKNRHSISIYLSLFANSNHRTVIASTSKKSNIEQISELQSNPDHVQDFINKYLSLSIELIMIKQTYYNEIAFYKILDNTTLVQLTKQYRKLIDINNEVFSLTFGGYGSLKRLLEYLELNLIDFLPQNNIEKILNSYKELISINESELSQKRNYIISLLAVLFPIFFGFDAIDNLTKHIDQYFKSNLTHYNLNLNSHTIQIWFFIVIISILLIYSHTLICFSVKYFGKLKYLYWYLKQYVLKTFYLVKNKIIRKKG